jgi:ubiquitin C-terminal hydrolase
MRGLINLGNTCYFNSAVQVLAHVPALTNRLLRDAYGGACDVTREYQAVVTQLWQRGRDDPVDPGALHRAFCARHASFATAGQHDAQEVILCMIDILEASLGLDFIRRIFNGRETQETVYPGGSSNVTGTFTTSVLNPSGPCSLESLLVPKWRTLEGFTDAGGKTHHVAAVRTVVNSWPMLTTFTFWPKALAELPRTLFGTHKLFAVVVHVGSADNGHYAVMVRHDKVWYLKDDEAVRRVASAPTRGPFYMALYKNSDS